MSSGRLLNPQNRSVGIDLSDLIYHGIVHLEIVGLRTTGSKYLDCVVLKLKKVRPEKDQAGSYFDADTAS